jgi:hypothetical protein
MLSVSPAIDYVVHMRMERFPAYRKSKIQPRGDGPFQILKRINDNSYKVDLSGENGVNAILMFLILPCLM